MFYLCIGLLGVGKILNVIWEIDIEYQLDLDDLIKWLYKDLDNLDLLSIVTGKHFVTGKQVSQSRYLVMFPSHDTAFPVLSCLK